MNKNRFYFILPDNFNRSVLLISTDSGWMLPYCETSGDIDLMNTKFFNKTIKEQFSLNVTTLCAFEAIDNENAVNIVAFENHTPEWKPPETSSWVSLQELDSLLFAKAFHKSLLEAWFAESSEIDNPMAPWSKIGWFDKASLWVINQLYRLGITVISPVEQVKSFYTGGTLRVNTDIGYIYLKAFPAGFVRELEITQTLMQLSLINMPTPIVFDSENCWMLMPDIGGTDLREISDMDVWKDVVRQYAGLQIRSVSLVDRLLKGSFFDMRIHTMLSEVEMVIAQSHRLLRGYYEPLSDEELEKLRSLLPCLMSLCARVESYGIPYTLDHGDLHAGNIRITKNGPVFYDWTLRRRQYYLAKVVRRLIDRL